MLQALKKLLLNNANVWKFYQEETVKEDKEKKIRLRIINSVALLNEMKLRMNTDEANEAVTSVLLSFEWLIKEIEEVESMLWDEVFDLEKKLNDMNYIIKNILEGFSAIE